MALIVIAADKGAPGTTTTALALASVWPNPVLLAECDPSGGDLMFRFPAADGSPLDPRRGLLSLAVAARRDYQAEHVWQHVQKIHGGLDVLAGVTNADQGGGLSMLWGTLGKMLASVSQADVIADCGRLGADGPIYDLLAEAAIVLLVSRSGAGEVIRLRDRAIALASAVEKRGRRGFTADVAVRAEPGKLKNALGEVSQVLAQAGAPARVLGGIADDSKGAELLRGTWGGRLDKTPLIRTVREVAGELVARLPAAGDGAPVQGDAPFHGDAPVQGQAPGWQQAAPSSPAVQQAPSPAVQQAPPPSRPLQPPARPPGWQPPRTPGLPPAAPQPSFTPRSGSSDDPWHESRGG